MVREETENEGHIASKTKSGGGHRKKRCDTERDWRWGSSEIKKKKQLFVVKG